MRFPVFDLHCDTAMALLGEKYDAIDSLLQNEKHIDLSRASTLPAYAQCFACFTSDALELPGNLSVVSLFEREMVAVLQQTEKYGDKIRLVYSADEVEDNRENGLMSAILTIEGPAGFGYNPELLADLYNIGFRITTLGWNDENPLTGSCYCGGGLTGLGREYAKEAQRVGMLLDVSHISDAGFWDIMEIAEKPVIASHSNSRAVWNHPRNITDDMYRALCQTGGTVGINLYADFLGENADADTVCDHILHFLEVAGDDRHLSLGSDFDGMERLPAGFSGIQDYPVLADRLLARGLDNESVLNIFWNNALGVINKCSM